MRTFIKTYEVQIPIGDTTITWGDSVKLSTISKCIVKSVQVFSGLRDHENNPREVIGRAQIDMFFPLESQVADRETWVRQANRLTFFPSEKAEVYLRLLPDWSISIGGLISYNPVAPQTDDWIAFVTLIINYEETDFIE